MNGENPKWIENSAALVFARFIMPPLIVLVMTGSGYFITSTIGDFKEQNKAMWSYLSTMTKTLNENTQNLALTNKSVDEINHDIMRMDGLINDHEARIRALGMKP